MKNKKGLLGTILIIIMIIIVGVIFLLNHFDIIELKSGLDYCKEDCEEMGLEYMSYNIALFSHNECWCKEGNETKRIY